MKVLLAFLIFAAISPGAFAKCATQLFLVTGVVVDTQGVPVPNALVGASWIQHSAPAGPAMALTDRNGKYTIPILFDTYSGQSLLLGDLCDETIDQISLTAYTSSKYSFPVLVSIGKVNNIIAPSLKIENEIQRESIW
jgi:hypothetical protein